jgi:aryl-alcohol dehydrogenase-like predicted oxidoreductase
METRAFGKTGLSVPVIGMGNWKTFDVGGPAAEGERGIIVARALDDGSTLFDTSPMYGESERVLADALRSRRANAIVADKIWASSVREGRMQSERALRWYGGSVDIYQIHNLVAWREHLPELETLRSVGSVRVIGATHYQHNAFPELTALMSTGRIGMIQIPYNAADRLVEREVLPLAQTLGLGVLIMRPLGAGALVRSSPTASALARLQPFGVTTWAQALLKWVVSDARVHSAIPATSKVARVTENALAGNLPWFDEDARQYVSWLAGRI